MQFWARCGVVDDSVVTCFLVVPFFLHYLSHFTLFLFVPKMGMPISAPGGVAAADRGHTTSIAAGCPPLGEQTYRPFCAFLGFQKSENWTKLFPDTKLVNFVCETFLCSLRPLSIGKEIGPNEHT